MYNLLASNLPLGLDFLEILLHLLNFAILIVGIRFLLYKPVRKFMKKREEEYRAVAEESAAAKAEAEKVKAASQSLIREARTQAVKISEDASAAAKLQSLEIMEKAHKDADLLIEKTKKEMENEKIKAREELVNSASRLAINIAEKLLEREISSSDNDILIDSVIDEWNSDGEAQ